MQNTSISDHGVLSGEEKVNSGCGEARAHAVPNFKNDTN